MFGNLLINSIPSNVSSRIMSWFTSYNSFIGYLYSELYMLMTMHS